MNLLSIDAGTYSVKFLRFFVEKRRLKLQEVHEVIIDKVRDQLGKDSDLFTLHAEIIKSNMPEDMEGKIILQLPNHLITSRYLTLPVVQRKKVEMMIPFQLDDHLPFSTINAHYIQDLEKEGSGTKALINVAKLEPFDEYFSKLEEKKAMPSVLTSELAVIHSYFQQHKIKGPAAYLDIGHETTKCSIIYQERVISNHFSHTAGKVLDEIISKTYQVSTEEAALYKHENCFFLTEGQYEGVNEKQKEFAEIMKEAIWPLILDVKRWLLGFRVKHGLAIEQIYLTGGTANIKNIENFLSQTLKVKVEPLNLSDSVIDKNGLLPQMGLSYNMATLMAETQQARKKPGNFLHGAYSRGSAMDLPLHSSAFIASRVAMLSLVLSFFLVGEAFILKGENKKLTKKISKLIKSESIGLSKREQRDLKKRPHKVFKKLKKRSNTVSQEVKTIQAAAKVNAVKPLSQIGEVISLEKGVVMQRFASDGELVKAEFSADKSAKLEALRTELEQSELKGVDTQMAKGGLKLSVTFGEQ